MKRKTSVSGIVAVVLCAAVVISACAACSSSGSSAPKAATQNKLATQATSAAGMADKAIENKSLAAVSSGAAATGATAAAAAALSKQKIIEQLSYQIETLKFDESAKIIQTLCTELGGYMQNSSVDGKGVQSQNLRGASYVLRIPQGKLGQFKNSAGNIGNVLNFTSSSENVSDKYFDTEARLKSLRTQQERLLALLTKSGSLTDVIALEKALAEVNYQIEQFTGTLREYDSLIDFSTVSIQLNEVVKSTEMENIPVTLGDKIGRQFKESVRSLKGFGEGMLVFFIGGAPILLLLAVLVVVVILIIRKRRKHERNQNEEPMVLITTAKEKTNKDEHPEN